MKKTLACIIGLIILAGCSKKNQYTNDLTGSWYIYNLTYFNVNESTYLKDSLGNYMITFTSNGQYTEQYIRGLDSIQHTGTWQFENSYGLLLLTDTANVRDTFTILDLTGNSVQLLSDGYDRYMRKNP